MDENIRKTARKLSAARTDLLTKYPFYGRLLLHMPFGFAKCETAYTDMNKIVFDPEFAEKLSDDELEFVLCHELMHCVLRHCRRGKGCVQFVYNIACDIVVNSIIMETLGISSYEIDSCDVMHLAPDKTEGRLHTAEEVYKMLLSSSPEELEKAYANISFDSHYVWQDITSPAAEEAVWDSYLQDAARACGDGSGIPYGMKRYLKDILHTPKTNWRQLLHDFIQHDRADYTFSVPDKRFQGDIIMPSFCENISGEKVDKLWFLIDTSGSISSKELVTAYSEIKDSVEQIENLSGMLFFFDTKVTDPIPFDSVKDFENIEPVGGGGTDFASIFVYLKENFDDDLPKLIIIATDGYDDFPPEDVALDVSILWLIIGSNITPPWGKTAYIEVE